MFYVIENSEVIGIKYFINDNKTFARFWWIHVALHLNDQAYIAWFTYLREVEANRKYIETNCHSFTQNY